jgi:transforming growth factor-beta-induced protein
MLDLKLCEEVFGLTEEELLSNALLEDILLMHVVSGALASESLVPTGDASAIPTLSGQFILLTPSDGGVALNNTLRIVQADITATNGVLHIIDGVMLPPISTR